MKYWLENKDERYFMDVYGTEHAVDTSNFHLAMIFEDKDSAEKFKKKNKKILKDYVVVYGWI